MMIKAKIGEGGGVNVEEEGAWHMEAIKKSSLPGSLFLVSQGYTSISFFPLF